MSTDHMPNPPDQPTKLADQSSAQTQAAAPVAAQATAAPTGPAIEVGAEAQAQVQAEPAAPALSLAEDIARVLEEQVDVIVQRQNYHSQLLLGVSGIGTDVVNARNSTLTMANALRNSRPDQVIFTLSNLGDAQRVQINDQSMPFKFNAQIAGLFEGIILDTVSSAFKADAARQAEARVMLETLFVEANEALEGQSKSALLFQAPGPHPNART